MARSADFLRTKAGEHHSGVANATRDDESFDELESDEPVGRSYEEERDWRGAGVLSLGIIAGALVGAGVALLLAPRSGEETREEIANRARRLGARVGARADESWDDLRDELRRLRRRSGRAATRGRWKVEDMLD